MTHTQWFPGSCLVWLRLCGSLLNPSGNEKLDTVDIGDIVHRPALYSQPVGLNSYGWSGVTARCQESLLSVSHQLKSIRSHSGWTGVITVYQESLVNLRNHYHYYYY